MGPDHGTGHFVLLRSIPQLAVEDSAALVGDQRIAKSRQTSTAVSARKTAPPQLYHLPA
jgi:hypothetical protein